MDFDLNFARFFGAQIDFFRKAESSEICFPRTIQTPKIVIFLMENAIFYKIDDFALKWKSLKNAKNVRRKRIKINLFFNIDFLRILEPTWVDFGLQVGLQQICSTQVFSKRRPRGVQEASKRRPRAPKRAPRAPQERPRGPQERPGGPQERPKGAQERPKSAQGTPKCRFSVFFCVSACFYVFLRVFQCFSAF